MCFAFGKQRIVDGTIGLILQNPFFGKLAGLNFAKDLLHLLLGLFGHHPGTAAFNQLALAEALTGDRAPLASMRSELAQRGRHMWRRLTAIPGVRCPRPTGAFYCFPNVSGTFARFGMSGSAEFADRLLEEARVAVVPGVAFGLDAHVRLSYAISMEQIDEGLSRIEAFLR